MACVHLSYFPFFFFFLFRLGLGSVSVWGWGLAFTQCCYHTVIFYLTKIGEASRSFWLNPRAVRGAAGDSRMKMFQGFGKVDLPKLKWRSERRDGNARAMGGVLAAWLVAVKRQSLPLVASGFWLLAAAGCCWACRNGENCFQRSAMKSTDLDQSREHFRLEFPFSLQTFPCLGRRASLSKWLICLFLFLFSGFLSPFFGLTARNMSAN